MTGIEAAPGRWLRINKLFFYARDYFRDGGFSENEDATIALLHKDIEGTIERPYCVEYDNCFYEGFHKDTTAKEAANRLGLSAADIVLKPYSDEQFGPQYDPYEVYRFEFMKTLILIFREDFPEYFGN